MDLNKCRICLQDVDEISGYRSLFEPFKLENDTVILSATIMDLTKIEIHPNDGWPEIICSACIKQLNACIVFIQLCQQSDIKLRNWKQESDDELCMDIDISDDNVKKKNENIKEIQTINNHKQKSRKQQCFTCGKVMSSRYRLKTHLVTHTGERPFSCIHCGKKFSLAQTLNVHMRIHTGEKPFRCSICTEEFAHSAGLIAHTRKHTGQLPYSCNLCPRKFRTIGHLQYHVRRHTGQKNYDCDTCGRAFITRNDLKQHLLSHSNEKPLVCCICGLRLSRASNLKRHIKLAHKKDEMSLITKITPKNIGSRD